MKATRQQLENLAHDIIVDAYEGWTARTWAIGAGDYKWGTEKGLYELDGDSHFASVTLYDAEALEEITEDEYDALPETERFVGAWGRCFRLNNPLTLTHTLVADFIEKVGTGEFDQSNLPEYGQLSDEVLNALAGSYLFGEDGIDAFHEINDAIVSDTIVQMILLGEVTYG